MSVTDKTSTTTPSPIRSAHPTARWRDYAACAGKPTDWFFPSLDAEGDNHGRLGKAVCAGCPVRTECLTDAVATNEDYGLAGGAGEDLRRSLRRAWLIDGVVAGPVWGLALVRHFRRLDGERLPVEDRNGPGATHGRRVTHARGCRCAACCLAAAVGGLAAKVPRRGTAA